MRAAVRWVLHPLAPALLLLGVASAAAGGAVSGVTACGALLAVAAGSAAGFANSGST